MKKLLSFSYCAVFMFLINSCNGSDLQNDSQEDFQSIQSKHLGSKSKTTLSDENYVTPVIFIDQSSINNDSSPCNKYRLYASSDVLSVNNRQVNIVIISNNTIIEGKTFTIPAGQYVSQTLDIFKTANKSYGNIEVKINTIKENGIVTNDYELKSIDTEVNNCYQSTPALPAPENPDCTDNNHNGYPDCYESH